MSLGSRSKAMGFIHLAFEDIREKGKQQEKRRETREPEKNKRMEQRRKHREKKIVFYVKEEKKG